MKCPECGSTNTGQFGRIERSDYGPDGDWYQYNPYICKDCGRTWEITTKCSDSAGDDDTVPIRGKE